MGNNKFGLPEPDDFEVILSPRFPETDLFHPVPNGAPWIFNPVLLIPPADASYGVFYFGKQRENIARLEAACRLMAVEINCCDYAIFTCHSRLTDPESPHQEIPMGRSTALAQMRIVSHLALEEIFGLAPEKAPNEFKYRQLTIFEQLLAFRTVQSEKYDDQHFPQELSGFLGGDGDEDRETYEFGFMVESAAPAVYRIWTHVVMG